MKMNPNERRTIKHRHISKMPLVIAFTFIVIAVVISIVTARHLRHTKLPKKY